MKLALRTEKGISILTASGSTSEADVAVLAAGIRKLLRDGKNRIILHIPEIAKLPTEAIRVLAQLNLAAAELAGQILLSGVDDLTRNSIVSFSKPPALYCFKTEAEAISFFTPPPTDELAAPAETPAAAPILKEEIRAQELGEVGALRKRLQDAEKEIQELSRLLAERLFAARIPDTSEKSAKKIQYLEGELEDAKKRIDAQKT